MTRPPIDRSWEDYLIPGTNVLRNKLTAPGKPYGEPDSGVLRIKEELRASLRLAELAGDPIAGRFDYEHMKAIHRHVFQDVYDWAGQERTAPKDGPMTKDGHAYYPAGEALTRAAHEQYSLIAASGYLRGMDRGPFVRELAERWGELNVVHSFREGNTRSQCVFFAQLCQQAGYHLDVAAFALHKPLRQDFVQTRYHCQDTGGSDRLATVLDKAVTAAPQPGAGTHEQRTRSLRDLSFPKAPGAGLVSPVQGAECGQSSRSYYRGHGQEPQSPGVGR